MGVPCTLTNVPFAEEWLGIIRSTVPVEILTKFVVPFTHMGGEFFYVFVLVYAFMRGWKKAPSLCYLVLLSGVINASLKGFFVECRPTTVSHLLAVSGFSFPSGHAQGAAVFWGFIALQLEGFGKRLLCILVALAIALSRPLVGVHYVHDVVVGTLLGFCIILLYQQCKRRGINLAVANHYFVPLSWALALTALFFAISDPYFDYVKVAGAFVGLVCGLYLLHRENRDLSALVAEHQFSLACLQVAGVFVWIGLRYVPFVALSPFFEALRYLGIALWVTFGAKSVLVLLCQRRPSDLT